MAEKALMKIVEFRGRGEGAVMGHLLSQQSVLASETGALVREVRR